MTPLRIVYDGECPFCTNYVGLLRLREEYAVELINARSDRITADSYNLDLNEGMIADLDGEVYHGAKAVALLSRLSQRRGILSSDRLANAVYPAMRFGRSVTLRLLGRKPL